MKLLHILIVNVSNDYIMDLSAQLSSANRHAGPSLMALTAVYAALTVAAIIVGVLLVPHSSLAMPYEPLAKEVAYVARCGPSIRWGLFSSLVLPYLWESLPL